MVTQPEVRLITLTGPGGIGKTRLALSVAERLRDRFDSRVVFVALASVTEPEMVLTEIGRTAGADVAGPASPLDALVERFESKTLAPHSRQLRTGG
jgi:predicted ATPase